MGIAARRGHLFFLGQAYDHGQWKLVGLVSHPMMISRRRPLYRAGAYGPVGPEGLRYMLGKVNLEMKPWQRSK